MVVTRPNFISWGNILLSLEKNLQKKEKYITAFKICNYLETSQMTYIATKLVFIWKIRLNPVL